MEKEISINFEAIKDMTIAEVLAIEGALREWAVFKGYNSAKYKILINILDRIHELKETKEDKKNDN